MTAWPQLGWTIWTQRFVSGTTDEQRVSDDRQDGRLSEGNGERESQASSSKDDREGDPNDGNTR